MTSPSPQAGTLPNLLLIGASKCGTTSLHRYLTLHPEICGASVKETQYFVPLIYGEPLAPLSSYRQYFTECEGAPYRMESTAGYFHGGDALARELHQRLDAPRLLLLLRDPVERVWSYYRYMKAQQAIPASMSLEEYLERCWATEPRLPRTREDDIYGAVYGGEYARYLEEWLPHVGNRLYVTFLEDLQASPEATLAALASWLGVEFYDWTSDALGVSNPSVMYRNAWMQRVAIGMNRVGERIWNRVPGLKQRLRDVYYRVNGRAWDEAMSETQRAALQAHYAPHNQRLATMLNGAERATSLPDWLSDRF